MACWIFRWYNDHHRHSGIGLMTPAAGHHGQAKTLFKQRAKTLDAAFLANPKRQEQEPSTSHAAHRRLDQPTKAGTHPQENTRSLHTKLMYPGVQMTGHRSRSVCCKEKIRLHSNNWG